LRPVKANGKNGPANPTAQQSRNPKIECITQRRKEPKSAENSKKSWFVKESSLRPWHLCIFAGKILLEKQEDDG
jgi:hypothetical protein